MRHRLTDNEVVEELKIRSLEENKVKLSEKVEKYKFSWKRFLVFLLIGTLLFSYIATTSETNFKTDFGVTLVSVLILGVIIGGFQAFVRAIIRIAYSNKLNAVQVKLNEYESRKIQEQFENGSTTETHQQQSKKKIKNENSIYTDLISKFSQQTSKHLDSYYLQTQNQANKSFAFSLSAGVVGLIVTTLGILLMFTADDARVLSSSILTASGVLSECLASGFFVLYYRTISRMGEYHQKLIISQNITLALTILERLPEGDTRTESQVLLIRELTKNVNAYLLGDEKQFKKIIKGDMDNISKDETV